MNKKIKLDRDTIVMLRQRGFENATIAGMHGVSLRTIVNRLQEWGVVTPRGGDRRSKTWHEKFRKQVGW